MGQSVGQSLFRPERPIIVPQIDCAGGTPPAVTALYRHYRSVDELNEQFMVAPRPSGAVDHARRFTDASAALLSRTHGRFGIAYGATMDEYLDIIPPSDGAAGPRPVFVFIHGGFWRAFSARDFAFAAAGPTAHGMLTVNANYTLAPQASLSEITRQMRAAVIWVARNIADHGGDPGRIIVGGHSAGGHLAAMVALTDWSRYGIDTSPVHAVHAISGVFDLRPLPYTALAPWLQLGATEITRQSPMLHDLPATLPDFDISFGTGETAEFQRQSRDFANRLTADGHRATLLPLPGADHFDAVLQLADPDSPLSRRISHLGRSRPDELAPDPVSPGGRVAVTQYGE